jgi:hypothetical protein
MQVYQTDFEGIFVGAVIADPSPLEPDVWLIPAGCVEVAPPEYSEKQLARWVNGAWVIENVPAPKVQDEPKPQAPSVPTLTRVDFVVALTKVPVPPIFTDSEALDALENFPPKFAAALADKPLAYRAAAVDQWRSITMVPRDAPLFLDLLAFYAAQAGLTEAQAVALGDAIFEAVAV